MLFKDIPGKEKEKEFLLSTVKDDRIAHAQLFLGRPGSGQLALALAYGNYLQCKDRGERDSCGVCTACKKNSKFIHPDFHFTFPVIKKDGLARKDTTSNDFLEIWRSTLVENPFMDMDFWTSKLNVENNQPDINTKETSHVVNKLALKSFESEFKVFIIYMPEYLRKEGNRLLKIIEEPTDKTVIILVAENADEILGTILSRTQLLKVHPFTDKEVEEYLLGSESTHNSNINQIVKVAEGNLSAAISRSHGDEIDYSETLIVWLRLCYKMEPVELSKWVNQINKTGRESQKSFMQYVILFLREFIYSDLSGMKSEKLLPNESKLIDDISKILTVDIAEAMVSILDESIMHISRNANGKISFMSDSILIGRMMRSRKSDRDIYKV